MTVAVLHPSFPGFRAAARRLALALAISAVAHLYLVQSLVFDVTRQAAAAADAGPITVRIETPSGAEPAGPAAMAPEPPLVAPRERMRAAAGTHARPKPEATVPLALPQAPDPTYYPARDLDVYPRPAAPLDLDRLARGAAGDAAGRFRLALLIDEDGVVKEIAVIEAGAPVRLQEALRAALAATRFLPAQKDGRAVRSRIVLGLEFSRNSREP